VAYLPSLPSLSEVKRLRFIKRAHVLGFTLDEIENLLRLDGANTCADTRNLAAHKLELIAAKMADLAAMQAALASLVQQCGIGDKRGECPIINALLRSEISLSGRQSPGHH
jgi:MerR family mercuric resistance operon transcriptional regulator